MANEIPIFHDADLVAFVDRRLPEAKRKVIAECASRDSLLAARIAILTDGTPALAAAFSTDLSHVPPDVTKRIEALVAQKQEFPADTIGTASNVKQFSLAAVVNRRRWLVGSSAMAASFALGLWGGHSLIGGNRPNQGTLGKPFETDWREAVAQYHALYGKQTIERLNPTADEKTDELSLVSKALGYQLANIDQSASGYIYRRAQLLEFNGKPLVQIVFEAPGIIPLAYCLKRQGDNLQPTKLALENRLGMPLAFWSKDGIDHLIVGRISHTAMQTLADGLFARS